MNTLQRTDAWFAEREGKLTASAFGQAIGIAPGSRQQLWRRLLKLETFEGNAATDYGTEHEADALAAYQRVTNAGVKLVGLIVHREHQWLACSPDGLVEGGLIEIKCPFTQQIYDTIPPYYMAQIQGQMEITGRDWCDLICWTPTEMRIWTVKRSPAYWQWMHVKLADFWSYVQAEVEPPRQKKPSPPATDDLILADEWIDLLTQ